MPTASLALITGGSSGIGQGTAVVLAEHGYDVAITYSRNEAGARDTQHQVEALGRRGSCPHHGARLHSGQHHFCHLHAGRVRPSR